jgi:hypothetical protein
MERRVTDDSVDRDAGLQKLFDHHEIVNIVYKYCRGIDRRDEALLRSVYWEDAVEDHGIMLTGVDDFVRMAMEIVETCVVTHHQIGNVLAQIDGDQAKVESYVHLHHRIEGRPPRRQWPLQPAPVPADQKGIFTDFFCGGRYLDQMEKRNGSWRILRRKVAYDWFRVVEGDGWSQFPYSGVEHYAFGSHGPSDPAHRLLERID